MQMRQAHEERLASTGCDQGLTRRGGGRGASAHASEVAVAAGLAYGFASWRVRPATGARLALLPEPGGLQPQFSLPL